MKAAPQGATITVGPGTYNERVNVKTAGITVSAPQGATVDATGASSTLYGFDITATAVTIEGFTVTNQTSAGIYVDGTSSNGPADGAMVSNVTAVGPGGVTTNTANGIKVTSANNVTVTNVTVHGYARAGVLLQGATNSTVSSSETYQNQREGVSIQGGSGDVVENVTTHDNVNLDGTGRLAPGINVTNWVPSAGAAAVPATSITVQRNTSFGNDDSGIQIYGGSQGITVRRNLTYDNGDHGIDFSMASTGTVVSNTALNNFTAGINIESDGTTGAAATVRDNIAVDNGNGDGSSTPLRTRGDIRVDDLSVTNSTIDHDLVFDSTGQTVLTWGKTTYSSLDGFRKAVANQEVHGLQADPMLTPKTYVPDASSPAIDAADAGAPGFTASDLYGNAPVDDPAVADTGTGTPPYADLGAIELTNVPTPPANNPPTAKLTATPSTVTAGGTVKLDASGSSDSDGSIISYAFDCGNGVTKTKTSGTATCNYPSQGSYTAKVTVTDDQGATGSASAPVTVTAAPSPPPPPPPSNQPPTAKLTASPSSITAGGTLTLDATGSSDTDGSIAKYAFDCGNGSTPAAGSTAGTATCSYPDQGSYTAKVTVTDDKGASDTASATVTVTAQAAVAPTAVLQGGRVHRLEPIRIDARGSHGNGGASIVSYLFHCGGRVIGPKPGPRARCVFHKVGVHRVAVRVTDSNGLSARAVAHVRVVRGPRPVASLALSDHRILVGDSVLAFAGRSHGTRYAPIKAVRFVCGNGQHSGWRQSRTYRCRYDSPGRYTVRVIVRNTLGLRAVATRVVRVRRG